MRGAAREVPDPVVRAIEVKLTRLLTSFEKAQTLQRYRTTPAMSR